MIECKIRLGNWSIGVNHRSRHSFGGMGTWHDVWITFLPVVLHFRWLVKDTDEEWNTRLHEFMKQPSLLTNWYTGDE